MLQVVNFILNMWNYRKAKFHTFSTSVHTWWKPRPQVPETTLADITKNIATSQHNLQNGLSNIIKEIERSHVEQTRVEIIPLQEKLTSQARVLTLYKMLFPIVGESATLSQEDRLMKKLLINKLNNMNVNVTQEINTLLETPTLTEEDRERLQQLALLKNSTNFSREITVSRDPTQSAIMCNNDIQLRVDFENILNGGLTQLSLELSEDSVYAIKDCRENNIRCYCQRLYLRGKSQQAFLLAEDRYSKHDT